ncbi:hypothetical protein ACI2VP_05170 [Ralstonia nicotianae]
MADRAQKALAACAEYDRLMLEIAALTTKIGESMEYCTRMVTAENGVSHFPDGAQSHIAEAYAGFIDDNGFGPEQGYWPPEEVLEMVSECPHCLAAHQHVQARKLARKRLGIAKRKIRAIGRAAGDHHD